MGSPRATFLAHAACPSLSCRSAGAVGELLRATRPGGLVLLRVMSLLGCVRGVQGAVVPQVPSVPSLGLCSRLPCREEERHSRVRRDRGRNEDGKE